MNNPAATSNKGGRRPLGVVLAGIVVIVLVIGVFTLVGRATSTNEPLAAPVAGVSQVAVQDNDFDPEAIEVPVGTTVTWRWEGDNDHNVVGEGFESPVQETGSFAHTFSTPGSYDYRCTLHGSMRGTVLVAAEAAS